MRRLCARFRLSSRSQNLTPAQIIALARHIVNDADPEHAWRQMDDELLLYVNHGIKEISTLAPQYFYRIGDMECTEGEVEQAVTFDDALAFAEVLRHHDGRAVLPADMAKMSAFRPQWSTDPAGPAENWFAHAGNPLRFFIYPKAPPRQILCISYVRDPPWVGLNEDIADLPDAMAPALANYVVAQAESKDDEHVDSGRAVLFYNRFTALVAPGASGGAAT
jgi:hypothetical protein